MMDKNKVTTLKVMLIEVPLPDQRITIILFFFALISIFINKFKFLKQSIYTKYQFVHLARGFASKPLYKLFCYFVENQYKKHGCVDE